jgi:limonene-1,2-epoxide hydrolase
MMTQNEIVMRRVFAAVNAYDTAAVLRDWNPQGIYDNPSIGAPAHGHDEVFARIDGFVQAVKKRQEIIALDRVIAQGDLVITEWHIEPASTGKCGVHIAEFDKDNRLKHVRVYPVGFVSTAV